MTTDSPDFSGAALITGSQPSTGNPITTVPVTLDQIVSIVEAAGLWYLVGQSNASIGPGGSASESVSGASGTEVYALDYIWCALPSTQVAADLQCYLAVNNYQITNAYSVTSGRTTLQLPLNGLVLPNNTTVEVVVKNVSASYTYLGIQYGIIYRVVTP